MPTERRIEKSTSRTAEMTCLSRASSYFEENPHYHSEDYIAPMLLPKMIKYFIFLKVAVLCHYFLKKFAPHGIYEYTIARTEYIDEIVSSAPERGIRQVLIFGAGFDTRGIRLLSEHADIKVFELDAPITQINKLQQMKKRGIQNPSNLIYISIDFNKEDVREKLDNAGFQKGICSLFIMEGLLMYLDPASVAETFQLIKEYTGPNSEIVFDSVFASVIRRENIYFGEEEIYNRIQASKEPWVFGIEKNEIKSFLNKYSFSLLETLDSSALEHKYFTNNLGNLVARVNGTHCIVYARIH